MRVAHEVPRFSTSDAPAATADVDLLIVPIAQDQIAAAVAGFDAATGGELSSAVDRGEFSGKPHELLSAAVSSSGWRPKRVLFVGGGPRSGIATERIRRMAISAAHEARKQRRSRLAWADVEPGAIANATRVETIAEGLTLGNFDAGLHKSTGDAQFFVAEVTIVVTSEPRAAADAAAAGAFMGDSVNAARVLVNEPGNYLTPRVLAERAAALAQVPGITIDIVDENRIEALGMGLLLGVARGSAEPPRLLVLRYEPASAPAGSVLGLVGKGVTFDSGGLSLKPADGMERMKDDMAGGATVIAAIRCIAQQQLPIRVIAVVPMTENLPGGRAVKPGDVLRGASGITVEVNNTDAEGRLILGDALWYARTLGATHIIDVATLTGAVVVALGKITTGLFGTPDAWVDQLRTAAATAGEKVWPLPLWEGYCEPLKSEIADLVNSPGRPAGSITAAMFLKEFAGTGPWAHLDIAGTAWAEDASAGQQKGATGAMIRTLVEVARLGLKA